MKKLFILSIVLINALYSFAQYNSGHENPRRYYHGNRSGQGSVAIFTVIGGVSCLLAPGVQFSSGIGFGVSSYNSNGDALLFAAGVILIGISIALIIANERNKMRDESIRPLFKYERIEPIVSSFARTPGFPALGIKIPLK